MKTLIHVSILAFAVVTFSLGAFAQSSTKQDSNLTNERTATPFVSAYKDIQFGKDDFSHVRGTAVVSLVCTSVNKLQIKYAGSIIPKGVPPQQGEPGYVANVIYTIEHEGEWFVNSQNEKLETTKKNNDTKKRAKFVIGAKYKLKDVQVSTKDKVDFPAASISKNGGKTIYYTQMMKVTVNDKTNKVLNVFEGVALCEETILVSKNAPPSSLRE